MSNVNDSRRRMLISSGIAAASLALPQMAAQAAETEKGAKQMSSAKPSIVFCHGIWADGSRFSKVAALTAALIATVLLLGNSQKVVAAEPTGIKNVVLVHGAFADGSGWEAVAKILKNDGYKVSVAQPPETSYAEDQKYTKAAIDAMGGPVVLVGHSYGGSIVTEAGNHPNVAALVYIAAFALDEGESCASIEQAAASVQGVQAGRQRELVDRRGAVRS